MGTFGLQDLKDCFGRIFLSLMGTKEDHEIGQDV